MIGRRILTIVVALGFGLLTQAVVRAADEAPGQVLSFKANVGTGYNCGRESSPFYCYGIPVNIGADTGGNGSFWLDTYVTGYNAGTGFVLWMGVADLGEATVTRNVPTLNSSGQVSGAGWRFICTGGTMKITYK